MDGPLLVAAGISLAAGLVSFASPCVLPLVPGYLAFVSGLTGAQAQGTVRARWTGVLGSVLFVLGFATVFTILGGAFGALGRVLAENRDVVSVVGGALVLLMGLFLLGVLRPAAAERDTRRLSQVRRGGLAAAFPLGVVFGAAGHRASGRRWRASSRSRPRAAGRPRPRARSWPSSTRWGWGCPSWPWRWPWAGRAGCWPSYDGTAWPSSGWAARRWCSSGCCC